MTPQRDTRTPTLKSRLLFSNRRRAQLPAPSRRYTAGEVMFSLLSVFCFLLILRNADAAIEYMGRGLSLCAKVVIPSLFPFMVISELLVSSGAGEAFGRLFSRIMKWLFGLSGAGVSALFLGSFCGFPVGARTAVALYDSGRISQSECEHLLTFTSNPSSAFLMTAVGLSMFGDKRLGAILYAVVLGSGFFVGFVARFLLRGRGPMEEHPHFPSGLRPGGVSMFTAAVTGAAGGMLTVCAYVIFFSALTGALSVLPLARRLGEGGYALLSGALEMTSGISIAAGLSNRSLGLIFTAGLAGWSGISVHCQVITLCGGRGLSFKPYILAKAAQGLLSAGVMALLLYTRIPALVTPGQGVILDAFLTVSEWRQISMPRLLCDGLFAAGVIGRIATKRAV